MSDAHARFTFRPLTREDFPMLARWLATPDVRRWWHHEFTDTAVERDFGVGVDGGEPGENLVALADGDPVGLVQRCRLTDYPEYADELAPVIGPVSHGVFSIDYLLGAPHLIGRGIGPAMIAAVSADTFVRHPDADRLVVPVNVANRRSWRALEKAGFALIADADLTPDNPIDSPAHHVFQLDRPSP